MQSLFAQGRLLRDPDIRKLGTNNNEALHHVLNIWSPVGRCTLEYAIFCMFRGIFKYQASKTGADVLIEKLRTRSDCTYMSVFSTSNRKIPRGARQQPPWTEEDLSALNDAVQQLLVDGTWQTGLNSSSNSSAVKNNSACEGVYLKLSKDVFDGKRSPVAIRAAIIGKRAISWTRTLAKTPRKSTASGHADADLLEIQLPHFVKPPFLRQRKSVQTTARTNRPSIDSAPQLNDADDNSEVDDRDDEDVSSEHRSIMDETSSDEEEGPDIGRLSLL